MVGDVRTIEEEAHAVADIMERVGETIAGIQVDAEVDPKAFVIPGERYFEKRGLRMFNRVTELLREVENG